MLDNVATRRNVALLKPLRLGDLVHFYFSDYSDLMFTSPPYSASRYYLCVVVPSPVGASLRTPGEKAYRILASDRKPWWRSECISKIDAINMSCEISYVSIDELPLYAGYVYQTEEFHRMLETLTVELAYVPR